MAEIIDLFKPKEDPHVSGEARCMECEHTWVAVAPIGVTNFECPNCHTHKGVWCSPIAWSAYPVRTCECGNQFYHITPEGAYCPRCGDWDWGIKIVDL